MNLTFDFSNESFLDCGNLLGTSWDLKSGQELKVNTRFDPTSFHTLQFHR